MAASGSCSDSIAIWAAARPGSMEAGAKFWHKHALEDGVLAGCTRSHNSSELDPS
jgi:hypothetical protein